MDTTSKYFLKKTSIATHTAVEHYNTEVTLFKFGI